MVPFFPTPLHDELLYSVICRYSDRRKLSHSQVVNSLMGKRNLPFAFNFPTGIDRILSVIPNGHSFTSDQFIDRHTLLPFYSPFIAANKVDEIRHLMKAGASTAISAKIGINASRKRIQKNTRLRYCPLCASHDAQSDHYYWHRIHQLPNIEVCPIHHVWLEDSDMEIAKTHRRFVSFEQDVNTIKTPRLIRACYGL